jgi:hypothetical protein
VSRHWFPANAQLLDRIRRGLSEGTYELDVDFLLAEIRTDFSLFMYLIREVMREVQREGLNPPAVSSPIELLRWSGLPRIKKILNQTAGNLSAHSLESMNDAQAGRLREAMVSASTSEVLAQRSSVDADLGYSMGLLRQLGLTLVAWNYPSVYQRVYSALKPESTIDEELSQALGFSPALLAISLLQDWGLGVELWGPIDDLPRGAEASLGVASTLREICRVGEALARATDPDHYPSAVGDWENAKRELEKRFGYEGLKLIQARLRENCESYARLLPQVFAPLKEFDPEKRIHQHREQELILQNQYVAQCPPEVAIKFKELYARLRPGVAARDAISFLVKDLVPFAGFYAGAVFIVEPASMLLEPRVQFGAAKLRRIRRGEIRSESAFFCSAPIIEHDSNSGPQAVVGISCVLGEQHRAGVLYLEIQRQHFDDEARAALAVFKAIRRALMDCLGMS